MNKDSVVRHSLCTNNSTGLALHLRLKNVSKASVLNLQLKDVFTKIVLDTLGTNLYINYLIQDKKITFDKDTIERMYD